MITEKKYSIPSPIVNKKEETALAELTDRYSKLVEPGLISKASTKIGEAIPESVKKVGSSVRKTISEAELFEQCMKIVAEGFSVLEKQAARASVNEVLIVKKINKVLKDSAISGLEEVCLVRSYQISKAVSSYKRKDLLLAFAEGGATGCFGFAGIPFNLVLSVFLYYRAVQSIAMFYGYDIKNDSAELIIASEVFVNALSPKSSGVGEISTIIGKVMVMTEVTAIKQTVKKSWAEMASRGGIGLLLVQMRALANKTAQKALEKAGQKGLENSLFREVFEQIGKRITKKVLGKAVPVAGAVIGALFDTAQMNAILEYADVFYSKRYILEKETRIKRLLDGEGYIS